MFNACSNHIVSIVSIYIYIYIVSLSIVSIVSIYIILQKKKA